MNWLSGNLNKVCQDGEEDSGLNRLGLFAPRWFEPLLRETLLAHPHQGQSVLMALVIGSLEWTITDAKIKNRNRKRARDGTVRT